MLFLANIVNISKVENNSLFHLWSLKITTITQMSKIIFIFYKLHFCFLFSLSWGEHQMHQKMNDFQRRICVVVLICLMYLPHNVIPYFQYPSVYWAPKNCRYAIVKITDVTWSWYLNITLKHGFASILPLLLTWIIFCESVEVCGLTSYNGLA